MTTLNYTVKFHKTVLASFIGLLLSQSCFALEAMTDEKLGDTTGEGIALLPQNAYMLFQGVGPNPTQQTDVLNNRSLDTGYIYYVPVGPLSTLVQDTNKDGKVNASDHSVGKADLYLYGLALSKNNNNDSNSRLDPGLAANGIANAAIKSWGTPTNPWLFNVKTDTGVPDFALGTSTGSVTSLNFEAPLYENIYSFGADKKTVTTAAFVKDAAGSDAYNLKLGMWADAFVRDQSKVDGDPNQFNLGENYGSTTAGRANRIRLQAIMNGFGLNGSKIQLFQTLGGSDNNNGMSAFYNNTLGLAGLIRLNSGDGSQLLGVVGSKTWTAPATLNNHVMRLSTQECGTGNLNGCTTGTAQALLSTPALNGTTAPVFDPTEGVFIYNLNTNLVLGSIYQPLIVGSDGTNFSFEVARIPNKDLIYKQIYTNYDDPNPSTNGGYYGSTCNIYTCGTSSVAGYQGNNATHSSIGIGTVYSPDAGRTLLADKTAGAVGISFGQLATNSTAASTPLNNLGSAVIDGLLIQHMKITTKGL